MQAYLKHIEANVFEGNIREHKFRFDTSSLGGKDTGPSPKETVLECILACSGIDIAGNLRKHKVQYDSFEMKANAEPREAHPKIFKSIEVLFEFKGKDLSVDRIKEAAELSMTKYCGVSAMIAPTSPIFYTIVINGEIECRDEAKFTL